MSKCQHCKGFGRTQIYRYGRVIQAYCDCEAGDKFVERIRKDSPDFNPKRISDYPSWAEYLGVDKKN